VLEALKLKGVGASPDLVELAGTRHITGAYEPLTALIGKDNLIASQFHQEKSGDVGLAMLKNFCEWNP
jgi:imidazoleglycerol phosphate synthase glutamine amidotransferase subunit HisH